MFRVGGWLVLLGLVVAVTPVLADSGSSGWSLIPVKPGYKEAAYAPGRTPAGSKRSVKQDPTPRDQMYVFYYLGKALSYPIDKVETMIFGRKDKNKKQAAAVVDPFEAVSLEKIPPAPPARKGAAIEAQGK